MKKLILVAGPAAVGKSTFSRRYAEEHPNEDVHIIAADEVRKEMTGGYDKFLPGKDMNPIYDEMVTRAHAFAKEGDVTIIFDTTMLRDDLRNRFADALEEFDYKELVLCKLHDYNVCLIRNSKRDAEKRVPEEIIIDMTCHYDDPGEETKKRFQAVTTVYLD